MHRYRSALFVGDRLAVLSLVASMLLFCSQPPVVVSASASRLSTPILLIHGLPAYNQDQVSCRTTWRTAKSYLQGYHDVAGRRVRWQGPLVEIKYYSGDTACDADLHSSRDNPGAYHCNNYYYGPYRFGAAGTPSEDIYHLSCLLAWYIYSYNQRVGPVIVVGHSFGGLMIRNAIYQVMNHKAPPYFPPTLAVSAVVTLEAPQGGITFAGAIAWFCYLKIPCIAQIAMLDPAGYFISEMTHAAQNPQAAGGTAWTMVGSQCDPLVQDTSAVFMSGGHKQIYDLGSALCPDHGTGLNDSSDSYNETLHTCNTCGHGTNADPPPWLGYYSADHTLASYYWDTTYRAPHYLHNLLYDLVL